MSRVFVYLLHVLHLVWMARAGVLATDQVSDLGTRLAVPVAGIGPDGQIYRTAYACQGNHLNISCDGADNVIEVVRANYGRFSVAICNEEGRNVAFKTDLSVNCLAENSLDVIHQKCGDASSCTVWATRDEFGHDPCNDTRKYLEVHYYCHNGTKASTPASTTFTTSVQSPPPWLTTATEPPMAKLPKKPRVPITVAPSYAAFQTTVAPSSRWWPPPASSSASSSSAGSGKTKTDVSDITNKFLSSSISSTNIMDTSETPVTLLSSEVTEVGKGRTLEPATTTSTTAAPPPAPPRRKNKASPSPKTPVSSSVNHWINPVLLPHPTPPPRPPPHPKASLSYANSGQDISHIPGSCAPRRARSLDWGWTRPRTTSVMPCPLGTSGLARWDCGSSGQYVGSGPDLSSCESIWLKRISEKVVEGEESIVHLAKDMLHYITSHPLFGGDLVLFATSVRAMTDKMRAELPAIPTRNQKSAVVLEVLQSVVRSASIALEADHVATAWADLPQRSGGRRERIFFDFLDAVKAAAMMVNEAMDKRPVRPTTVSSRNILLSVYELPKAGELSEPISFPSASALATKDWAGMRDALETADIIPRPDGSGAAKRATAVFVAVRILPEIFTQGNRTAATKRVERSYDGEPEMRIVSPYLFSLAVDSPNTLSGVTAFYDLQKTPIAASHEVQCSHWSPRLGSWTACQGNSQPRRVNGTHRVCHCPGEASSYVLRVPMSTSDAASVDLSAADDVIRKPLGEAPGASDSSQYLTDNWLFLLIVVLVSCVLVIVVLVVAVVVLYYRGIQTRGTGSRMSNKASFSLSEACFCCFDRPRYQGTLTSASDAHKHGVLSSSFSQSSLGTPTFQQRANQYHGATAQRDRGNTLRLNLQSPGQDQLHLHSLSSPPSEQPPVSQAWHTSGRWNSHRKKHLVAETPERPLLTDFPSPGVMSNGMATSYTLQPNSQQHIYMEITPWDQERRAQEEPLYMSGGYENAAPVRGGTHMPAQPIHMPLLLQENNSSSSSQSSGYGSSGAPMRSRPQTLFRGASSTAASSRQPQYQEPSVRMEESQVI